MPCFRSYVNVCILALLLGCNLAPCSSASEGVAYNANFRKQTLINSFERVRKKEVLYSAVNFAMPQKEDNNFQRNSEMSVFHVINSL